MQPNFFSLIGNYSHYFLLGIFGAIFANSTGAGGGVIFIPAFNQLGFSESQAIATSFGIQCFGMTAGAVTWWHYAVTEKTNDIHWSNFRKIALRLAAISLLGIFITYYFELSSPASLRDLFKSFSVVLGISILLITVYQSKQPRKTTLSVLDWFTISVATFLGGVITAWLSVGVGEIIAAYLILRRFDVMLSVAIAVVVSAITVWGAAIDQLLLADHAYWHVVLFAGPGALIGGAIAKHVVSLLSAKHVKIFFGFWVLATGVVS